MAGVMVYDASREIDRQRAETRFRTLIGKEKRFELREKKPIRTLRQNRYQHLIFSWFGLETGYTAEEVKQEIYKKIVNPDTFYDGEHGKIVPIQRWRSTTDLNTEETTLCIDRFRDYASREAGVYIPTPDDLAHLQHIEDEIGKYESKAYL